VPFVASETPPPLKPLAPPIRPAPTADRDPSSPFASLLPADDANQADPAPPKPPQSPAGQNKAATSDTDPPAANKDAAPAPDAEPKSIAPGTPGQSNPATPDNKAQAVAIAVTGSADVKSSGDTTKGDGKTDSARGDGKNDQQASMAISTQPVTNAGAVLDSAPVVAVVPTASSAAVANATAAVTPAPTRAMVVAPFAAKAATATKAAAQPDGSKADATTAASENETAAAAAGGDVKLATNLSGPARPDAKPADTSEKQTVDSKPGDGPTTPASQAGANAAPQTVAAPQTGNGILQTLAAGVSQQQQSAATPADGANAPAQTPPAPMPPAVPLAGLAVEIAGRALAGKNRFDIRLDPPELGRIEVRLDVDKNGGITSHVIADRKDTLDLLQRDASGLQRAFEDAGLKTSDNGLQFSLRDQANGGNQNAPAPQPLQSVPDDEAPLDIVPVTYARIAGTGGGLDIRV